MNYAVVVDGNPREIDPVLGFVAANGLAYPGNILSIWTQEELSAIGVYPIIDADIPPGKQVATSWLSYSGGQVSRNATFIDIPVVVPLSVTSAQGRLALFNAGKLDQVDTAISSAAKDIKIWYEYATIWERNNPILNSLANQLGLSSLDIDTLFISAATIR